MNVLLYVVIYPILAIALFFILNWLGKHSYSLGYHKIDFIVDREDSVAFNFSLKVLGCISWIGSCRYFMQSLLVVLVILYISS